MLKAIVQQSKSLVSFISALNLALYQPQKRHLIQTLEGLLVGQGRKTLSDLYRLWAKKLDPKTAADFFRESPWEAAAISGPRKRFMVKKFLEIAQKAGIKLEILVSVDDSLGKKGKATQSHAPPASGGLSSQPYRQHQQETGVHQRLCVCGSPRSNRPHRISV